MVFKFFQLCLVCQKTIGIKKFQSANLQDKKLIYFFFNGIFQHGFLDIIYHERLSFFMIPSVFSHRSSFSDVSSH